MKKPNINVKFDPKELLFFNRLIMPSILTGLFWVVLVLVVISALTTMFTVSLIGGLLSLVFGVFFTRISFELICVAFSINRNLEKLVQLQSGSKDEVTTPEDIGQESDEATEEVIEEKSEE